MFVRLEKLNAERDALDMDWGRLQLEQSYWSSHALVERRCQCQAENEPFRKRAMCGL